MCSDVRGNPTNAFVEANALLSAYWDGQPPVDAVAIARAMGVDVIFGMSAADVPGVSIAVPAEAPLGRQLRAAAVGLGEIVAAEREVRPGQQARFAIEFARALLVPEEELSELRRYGARVTVLAEMFCTTPDMIRERIRDIN